ncbi:MAG: hypothetical protein AB7V42_15325 [Thermoleophilia bacterium]
MFGDSVQASFGFAPRAVRELGRGLDLRMQARTCRRLVAPGCLGGTPPPVLADARALGAELGDVVVVNVGYNDDASRYDIPAVMSAFRAAGVRAVVWVTLRDLRGRYTATNALIRAAQRRAARGGRGPVVRIADWNAYSAGRSSWFASDGLHLNAGGALGLAGLLRREVLGALADIGIAVPAPAVSVTATGVPLGRRATALAGDGALLWTTAAGRLVARDGATGRALPRPAALRPGEELVSDGRQAWLRDAAAGTIARAARGAALRSPLVGGLGDGALIARAGARLWVAAPCDAAACPGGQALWAVLPSSGERHAAPPGPGRVRAVAAAGAGLWLLAADPVGAVRLERRDARTGELRSATDLPADAAAGQIAPGARGAWVRTSGGRVLAVAGGGAARAVRGGVLAIAAADGRLWAVLRDRHTVVVIDRRTGRARARAVSPVRLSDRMTFTRTNLWVLSASGRQAVRIRRF